MKTWRVTYYLMPDAANITIIIRARTYEDACIIAKGYRHEGFSCDEIV